MKDQLNSVKNSFSNLKYFYANNTNIRFLHIKKLLTECSLITLECTLHDDSDFDVFSLKNI